MANNAERHEQLMQQMVNLTASLGGLTNLNPLLAQQQQTNAELSSLSTHLGGVLAIPVGVANTLPVTGSALGLGSSLVSALHDTTSITDSFTSHHKSLGPLHPPVEIRPRPSTITRWTSRGRRGRMDDNNNKGKEGKGDGTE